MTNTGTLMQSLSMFATRTSTVVTAAFSPSVVCCCALVAISAYCTYTLYEVSSWFFAAALVLLLMIIGFCGCAMIPKFTTSSKNRLVAAAHTTTLFLFGGCFWVQITASHSTTMSPTFIPTVQILTLLILPSEIEFHIFPILLSLIIFCSSASHSFDPMFAIAYISSLLTTFMFVGGGKSEWVYLSRQSYFSKVVSERRNLYPTNIRNPLEPGSPIGDEFSRPSFNNRASNGKPPAPPTQVVPTSQIRATTKDREGWRNLIPKINRDFKFSEWWSGRSSGSRSSQLMLNSSAKHDDASDSGDIHRVKAKEEPAVEEPVPTEAVTSSGLSSGLTSLTCRSTSSTFDCKMSCSSNNGSLCGIFDPITERPPLSPTEDDVENSISVETTCRTASGAVSTGSSSVSIGNASSGNSGKDALSIDSRQKVRFDDKVHVRVYSVEVDQSKNNGATANGAVPPTPDATEGVAKKEGNQTVTAEVDEGEPSPKDHMCDSPMDEYGSPERYNYVKKQFDVFFRQREETKKRYDTLSAQNRILAEAHANMAHRFMELQTDHISMSTLVQMQKYKRMFDALKREYDGVEAGKQEMKHNYDSLKLRYDHLVAENEAMTTEWCSAKMKCENLSKERNDMKREYDVMKSHYDSHLEEKLIMEQELLQQSKLAHDHKTQFDALKIRFDAMYKKSTKDFEQLTAARTQLKVLHWLEEEQKALEEQQQNNPQTEEVKESTSTSLGEELASLHRDESISEVSTVQVAHFATSTTIHSLSDEMKVPLNTALGLLEMLLDERVKWSRNDQRDMIEKIWSALNRVSLQMNNVLDNSMLKSVGIRPVAKAVNVRRLTRELLTTLQVQAAYKKVEFIFDIHANVPTSILCDRLLLQRVLLNVMDNALKATRHHGFLVLSVQWDNNSTLHVQVIDNGEGMSKEEEDILFQIFCRGSDGKDSAHLGLSVSSKLVSAMGGSMSAYNRGRGEGSCIQFSIPAPVSKNVIHSNGYTVLVLDNNEIRLRATSEFLKYVGALPIRNVADAVTMPDMVLISVSIPSWMEVVKHWKQKNWKQDDGRPRCAICLLISNNYSKDTFPLDEVDCTLQSPIDVADLRNVLRKFTFTRDSDESSSPASSGNGSGGTGEEAGEGGEKGSLKSKQVACLLPDSSEWKRLLTQRLVLVVDGEQQKQRDYIRQLRNLGVMNVYSANTGAEAVKLAQSNKYCLILIGTLDPEDESYETTRRVRQIPAHSKTNIIALVASPAKPRVLQCYRDCGVSEVYTLPISPQKWTEILDSATTQPSSTTITATTTTELTALTPTLTASPLVNVTSAEISASMAVTTTVGGPSK